MGKLELIKNYNAFGFDIKLLSRLNNLEQKSQLIKIEKLVDLDGNNLG